MQTTLKSNSTTATAATVQDVQKLVEAGFEYVCDFNEVRASRKRK